MASIFEPSNAPRKESTFIQSPGKERNYFENLIIRQQTNDQYMSMSQAATGFATDIAVKAAYTAEVTDSAKADYEKREALQEWEKTTSGKDIAEVQKFIEGTIGDIDKRYNLSKSTVALESNKQWLTQASSIWRGIYQKNADLAVDVITNKTIVDIKNAVDETAINAVLAQKNESIAKVSINQAYQKIAEEKSTTTAIQEYLNQVATADTSTAEGKALVDGFMTKKDILRKHVPEDMKDNFDKIVKTQMSDVNTQNALQMLMAEAQDDPRVKDGKITVTDALQEKYSKMLDVTKRFNMTLEDYNKAGIYINNMVRMEEQASHTAAAAAGAILAAEESKLQLTDRKIYAQAETIPNIEARNNFIKGWMMQLSTQKKYKNAEDREKLREWKQDQHNKAVSLATNQDLLEQTDLKSLHASKQISDDAFQSLTTQKNKGSNQQVERVIKQINEPFGDFIKLIGTTDKAEILALQIRYTKAVQNFRNKNIDDPQFPQKFAEFVKELYRPVISRTLDNWGGLRVNKKEAMEAKIQRVEKASGLKTAPPTKIDINTITEAEIKLTAQRKGISEAEVKRRLGIK